MTTVPKHVDAWIRTLSGASAADPCMIGFDGRYVISGNLGNGTYGHVYESRCKITGARVAIKQLRDMGNGVEISSLREIRALTALRHPNIVHLHEVIFDAQQRVCLVLECAECTLDDCFVASLLSPPQIKCMCWQMLVGLRFLHSHNIMHRDIKMSNMLLVAAGTLKLCDFGMSRPVPSAYCCTPRASVTLWYRPPEILLGSTRYDTAVDVWGVGLIMLELSVRKSWFAGKTEVQQLDMIFRCCGNEMPARWTTVMDRPSWGDELATYEPKPRRLRQILAAYSSLEDALVTLVDSALQIDPAARLSCDAMLQSSWFTSGTRPCECTDFISIDNHVHMPLPALPARVK